MNIKSILKYDVVLFFFIALFFNVKINCQIESNYVFMIDTGSNKYISQYQFFKNSDIKSDNWLNKMLKNDIFRSNTFLLKNGSIDEKTKFSVNKDTDFVFCNCDYKDKKEANYVDFKCDKYDKDITKQLITHNFQYNSKNFYYFFILKKQDYESLFNIKFNKVEVFNKNIVYKKDNDREKVLYESKNKCSLGQSNNKYSLEETIIDSIKNNFTDFLCQEDDLRRDLFFANKITLKEIFSTPIENITDILVKLQSKSEENVLSLDLEYKDEADIKLVFIAPSDYNLNIDKSECTIHFNIREKFAERNYPDDALKRSITDVININTVRQELEKKDFKLNGKKEKLPTSCFDVESNKSIFDQYIIKIKIPEDDKENGDKTILLEKFLTKIPPKIEEKVEKNYCGYKKKKKNK